MKTALLAAGLMAAALYLLPDGRSRESGSGQAAPSTVVALHWTEQSSGVTARLRGVSAASDRVVWASGAQGTLLRTADGGSTWTRLPIPDAGRLDFRDIDAVDARTAYVLSIGAGQASRIYKTTDAGAQWQLQFTNDNPKAFFDAMAFQDATHGLAVSDSVDGQFVIITTNDGGLHWARIPAAALPPALPNEGAFAGSGTNIAVLGRDRAWIGTGASTRSRVLRTEDSGRTWSIADTPIVTSASAGIFSVAFRDPRNGLAVGGDYTKEQDASGVAAATNDGGVTWHALRGLGGFRSVIAPAPRSKAGWIAAGPSGADASTDDGRTWTPIPGPGYHAFAFAPHSNIGWGVGERGRIGKLVW
ncbi:MAG: WD40/YVTN/BNR-like repeat-containing protein [Vicinamibacterales bacterium]